jgi:hypothetical protein
VAVDHIQQPVPTVIITDRHTEITALSGIDRAPKPKDFCDNKQAD